MSTVAAAPRAGSQSGGTQWLIAPVVALAAFMEVLDISIANVSLQHIAGSLSVSQDESTWVLTFYLVTNAIVLPISGWLSSVLGRKRFFMGCIAGFSISSLLCGLAPNLALLIVFRALQGATGGGLQPSSQAILADSFAPSQRGMAFAFYGIAVVFAPAIGPTLGGWITDNFSWRWVFLINVPIGVILLFLTAAMVHDSEQAISARLTRLKRGLRIDYLGFGLLALGLGTMQLMLDRGQQNDWFASPFILSMAALMVLGLIAFVMWELQTDEPIVDLHLLRNPNFAIANVLMFMLGFILLGSTELIPQYVQSLLGYTATDAGLVITPGGFAIMLAMPIVGKLVNKVDLRWLIAFGLLVSGLALMNMSGFDTQTDYWHIAIARIFQALGLGFLFIPITTIGYVGVPPEKNNEASALINLARNLGGSIGISLLTTMLARRSQFHQNMLVEHISTYNAQYTDTIRGLEPLFRAHGAGVAGALAQSQGMIYNTLQGQVRMLAFMDNFWILAVIFLGLIPFVFVLKKSPPVSDGVMPH